MNDKPFLSERHGESRRQAVFEDTGIAAYLYLSSADSNAIVADAWVYNRIEAPTIDEAKSCRPDPPPAAEGYATAEAYLPSPGAYVWSFRWAQDGQSVAICADGVALAFIRGGQRRGFSRHLLRSGPWGEPWSDEVYEATFSRG